MKIAVIGATGFVGSAILQEALQRGHEVTAIVRNPEKVKPHPKLRPHKADVQKGDEVTRSVAGHDAVISAFNPGWSNPDIYNSAGQGHASHYRRCEESRRQATAVRRGSRQLGSQAGRPVSGSPRVPCGI